MHVQSVIPTVTNVKGPLNNGKNTVRNTPGYHTRDGCTIALITLSPLNEQMVQLTF